MLKKTIRRLGALAMVLAMAVSVFAVNASATEGVEATYTQIGRFTKKVTTDGHTFAPNTTFAYTVNGVAADGEATVKTSSGNTTIKYYAGKTGDVVFTDTAFAPGADATSIKEEYTGYGAINVKDGAYTKPGIYRYTVTEENGGYEGITYDLATRYLYVYVINKEDGTGVEVSGFILTKEITTTVDKEVVTIETKTDEWVNDYGKDNDTTHDVKFVKVVTGNMGDKVNDAFDFDVKVDGQSGEKYKVVYASTADVDATTTFVTSGTVATITGIKHTGYIQIYGLTKGDKYTVAEHDYSGNGYTTTYSDSYDPADGGTTTEDGTVVTVTNDKDASTPGGVIMTIAPYALMLVVAGAFAVVFLTRRNRAE